MLVRRGDIWQLATYQAVNTHSDGVYIGLCTYFSIIHFGVILFITPLVLYQIYLGEEELTGEKNVGVARHWVFFIQGFLFRSAGSTGSNTDKPKSANFKTSNLRCSFASRPPTRTLSSLMSKWHILRSELDD